MWFATKRRAPEQHHACVPRFDAAMTRRWCIVFVLALVAACSHNLSEDERLVRLRLPSGTPGAAEIEPIGQVYTWGPCGTIPAPTVRLATVPSDLHAVLCISQLHEGSDLNAMYLTDAGQIDRDTSQAIQEHGAILVAQTPLASTADVRTLDASDWELSVHLHGTAGVVSRGGVKKYEVRWRQMSNGSPIEIVLIGGRDGHELLALARNTIDGTPSVG